MDIMKILGKAKFPTEEELNVLGEIADEQKDMMISLWKAFYYGIVQGKREERAKRKRSTLASEIIADQQQILKDEIESLKIIEREAQGVVKLLSRQRIALQDKLKQQEDGENE